MTRWQKYTKEFDVSLSRDWYESLIYRIPKLVVESLNNLDSLQFKTVKNEISVEAENK